MVKDYQYSFIGNTMMFYFKTFNSLLTFAKEQQDEQFNVCHYTDEKNLKRFLDAHDIDRKYPFMYSVPMGKKYQLQIE